MLCGKETSRDPPPVFDNLLALLNLLSSLLINEIGIMVD
jgi:hypothetical protein